MTSLGSRGGGCCYGGLTTTVVVVEVGPVVCARRLRFHWGSGSGWLLMSFCLVGFWRVFCLLGHSLTLPSSHSLCGLCSSSCTVFACLILKRERREEREERRGALLVTLLEREIKRRT